MLILSIKFLSKVLLSSAPQAAERWDRNIRTTLGNIVFDKTNVLSHIV